MPKLAGKKAAAPSTANPQPANEPLEPDAPAELPIDKAEADAVETLKEVAEGMAATKPTKAAAAAKKAAKRPAAAKKEVTPFAGVADEEDEFLNILYAGRHGTGKTSDLATMANLGPVVFINAEGGLKRKPLARLGVNVDNISVWPNRRLGQELTFEGMEELFWRMRGDLLDRPDAYAGIVWDSVTEIHKNLLENVSKAAVTKAEAAGRERDRFSTEVGDYGTMTEQVRFLLRRFRDLPCHFGATALLRRDIDKAGDGGVVFRPAVTPALIGDLGAFMDMVCYTSVGDIGGDPEFRGRFRPEPMYEAKDRFGVITSKRLVDPTFERVLAYVHGTLVAEEDPVMLDARQRRAELAGAEAGAELAKAGAA